MSFGHEPPADGHCASLRAGIMSIDIIPYLFAESSAQFFRVWYDGATVQTPLFCILCKDLSVMISDWNDSGETARNVSVIQAYQEHMEEAEQRTCMEMAEFTAAPSSYAAP